ncbi:Methyltransferase domain-containing protein [Nocardioides terrae]|uniref:Methyltransferase domain-containing protein n=1 Tax=Nocardioides terrae TaxID=574651 RepID=A0A1I1ISX7_9ACTN|nr:class I SAM-dependent methyltransferase [Nocardioides terrae]SFC39305.1 Methyltransferase domain-containing protein [Nocardioides terrae]
MTSVDQAPSSSIAQPGYWWYQARSDLLRTVLAPHLGPDARLLDVGSADGPSVAWMEELCRCRVALDVDLDALAPGDVCGSALQLPFTDEAFDVVAAFDVVEHCDPESTAMSELARVLAPGGRMLLAVPAYQWAWTRFDVDAGHYRRYTRRRLVSAATTAGLDVRRATYIFSGTFPLFVAERLARRLRPAREEPDTRLPEVSPWLEKLLMVLCRWDQRVLASRDLPFGSSVVLVAVKPG